LWHNGQAIFASYDRQEFSMAIPAKKEILLPLLEYANAHGEFQIDLAIDALANHFKLSEAERRVMLESGRAKKYNIRVMFARLDLCKAGLLESTGKKMLKVTEAGRKVISECPEVIDHKFLMQFPGYAEVINAHRATVKAADAEVSQEESLESPEEALETGYRLLRKDLAKSLSNKLVSSFPSFFERVVSTYWSRWGTPQFTQRCWRGCWSFRGRRNRWRHQGRQVGFGCHLYSGKALF
jgi:restriction system protein